MLARSENSEATQTERWVRSEEARKMLKLSTCDLAHARVSGKIKFKKVGSAFLYLIATNLEDGC